MKKLLFATTALALLAGPACADTFHVDAYSQPGGAQNVTVTLGSLSKTVSAGEINLHQNNPALDILVWCIDFIDNLFVPYTYNVNNYTPGQNLPGLPAGGLDAGQARQIASLVLRGLTLGGADAGQDDAATQLAIWKVEYGNAISFSGLSSGLQNRLNLELADSSPGGLIDCPTCTLRIYSDDVTAPNQAMVTALAAPGPVVGAGFPGLVALLGGIWAWKNKRRRQDRGLTAALPA
jgi:hypothetical protein